MARCQSCGTRQFHIDLVAGVCDDCRARISAEHASAAAASRAAFMAMDAAEAAIILSTETAPALPIGARLGIVGAECIYGLAITKDLASAVRNVVGGRNVGVQNTIRDARLAVLSELRHAALSLDADAVISIAITYSQFSGDAGLNMLLCVATGTAVRFSQAPVRL